MNYTDELIKSYTEGYNKSTEVKVEYGEFDIVGDSFNTEFGRFEEECYSLIDIFKRDDTSKDIWVRVFGVSKDDSEPKDNNNNKPDDDNGLDW